MLKKRIFFNRLLDFFASKRFFYVVISLFLLQAVWIALSNNYGSPHDEKYHFGLVQVYSQQPTPFIEDQPESYDQFGDVERGTSYLYHYALSFPYKVASAMSDDVMFQVVFLRLINVLFVAASLFLFKKILDRLFENSLVSNMALFAVIMIPVFTYVAAGISYDNLVLLGFAAALYLTLRLIRRFSYPILLLWVSVNALTSLVKYAYLPLALALFVGLVLYYLFAWKKQRPRIVKAARSWRRWSTIVLAVIALAAGSLFAERYVGNVISYGTPLPDCAKILSAERCQSWAPWQRNELARERNETKTRASLPSYALTWVQKMQSTSLGIYRSSVTQPALPILAVAGWVLLALSVVLGVLNWKYLLRNKALLIALGSAGFFVAVLFVMNYKDYQALGIPVAIQGRYLILLLPLLVGMTLFFVSQRLERHKKVWAVFIALWIIVFLNGGLTTYLARTDTGWWWPNETVRTVNEGAQRIVNPFIIKG